MNPQNSPNPPESAREAGSQTDLTQTSDAPRETKTTLTQAAREAASQVKSAVSDTATRARDEAERIAADKKETAARRLSDYGSAIHESARSLEEKDPNIAWLTHRAADKLQSAADYMRSRDFSRLRYDAEDVARRHPAVFFGGMFLAGLILGNVVKSSRRKIDDGRYLNEEDNDSRWSAESTEPAAPSPELTEASRSAGGI